MPIGLLDPMKFGLEAEYSVEAAWFVGVCPISLLAFFSANQLQLASFRWSRHKEHLQADRMCEQ